MADANHASGQHMEQEAAEELVIGDGHDLLLAAKGVIAPEEGNLVITKPYQTIVGDGHSMRVSSQILQHWVWPTEWRLGVNNPILAEQLSEEAAEGSWVRDLDDRAVELKLVSSTRAENDTASRLAEERVF